MIQQVPLKRLRITNTQGLSMTVYCTGEPDERLVSGQFTKCKISQHESPFKQYYLQSINIYQEDLSQCESNQQMRPNFGQITRKVDQLMIKRGYQLPSHNKKQNNVAVSQYIYDNPGLYHLEHVDQKIGREAEKHIKQEICRNNSIKSHCEAKERNSIAGAKRAQLGIQRQLKLLSQMEKPKTANQRRHNSCFGGGIFRHKPNSGNLLLNSDFLDEINYI